ncbi:hypothetical protein Rsub_01505 [Raphidocelis subcapitata]|uniref:SET domain-containing protein n=1 Tax=Raphidocelis subcapitata TaxID=307507 RepID=A0A2V0NN86_9CHLO|nr:hypothetical protein Rsub_01505 [Raphidocelis subcapitata]|eukprot:GBF89006.1 hypothetical protein Rsub_01505 [Raphidocelis subcapitata]
MIKPMILVMALAALAAAPAARAQSGADAALWAWLTANGAALNFQPKVADGGVRGGVAVATIPKGGLVASIPMKLAIRFPANYASFPELGELLALEDLKADSPFRPYLDSLPSLSDPHHTLAWESFPPEYLHLLTDSTPLVDQTVARQATLEQYWARHGARLAAKGVSLEKLRAALVTITARWFEGPSDGPDAGQGALVPGLDSLNHRNDCPVSFSLLRCPPLRANTEAGADESAAAAALKAAQANEVCVIARTAEEIPAGEEVCISYGNLAPDVTLLQYGFLPAGQELALSRVDERGASIEDVTTQKMHSPAPPKLTSAFATAQQLRTERARLAGILSHLRETEAVAAATPRAAADGEGKLLALVLKWRAQRAGALEAEVARLDKAVVEAEARPETGSEAVKKLADEL